MAAECELTQVNVQIFISDRGGKVTNHELVKHFKKYLSGTDRPAEAREKFKEIVNAVATIKQEEGVKYLVLKKKYAEEKRKESDSSGSIASFHSLQETTTPVAHEKYEHVKTKSVEDEDIPNGVSLFAASSEPVLSMIHSYSSPSFTDMMPSTSDVPLSLPLQKCNGSSPPGPWSPDLPPGHTPQPPPRRKNSARGKENRGSKFEESVRQLNEEKENLNTSAGQAKSHTRAQDENIISTGDRN